VRGCLGGASGLSLAWLARPLFVMGLLFAAAAYLGQHLLVDTWLAWTAAVMLTLLLALVVVLSVSLPPALRTAVLARVAEMARRLRSGEA
jgi:hypothetical protein